MVECMNDPMVNTDNSWLYQGKERELRLAAVFLLTVLVESSDGNAVRCVRAGALPRLLAMCHRNTCIQGPPHALISIFTASAVGAEHRTVILGGQTIEKLGA
eukprot:scaffold155513_cov18-Prasinocladus_malaysianus.AAC.1